jgi:hypothetical protein
MIETDRILGHGAVGEVNRNRLTTVVLAEVEPGDVGSIINGVLAI